MSAVLPAVNTHGSAGSRSDERRVGSQCQSAGWQIGLIVSATRPAVNTHGSGGSALDTFGSPSPSQSASAHNYYALSAGVSAIAGCCYMV